MDVIERHRATDGPSRRGSVPLRPLSAARRRHTTPDWPVGTAPGSLGGLQTTSLMSQLLCVGACVHVCVPACQCVFMGCGNSCMFVDTSIREQTLYVPR